MGKLALGRAIAKARAANGLTQKALAERAGLGKRAVEQWEAGRREPSASNLAALSAALSVTCQDLLAALTGPDPAEDA